MLITTAERYSLDDLRPTLALSQAADLEPASNFPIYDDLTETLVTAGPEDSTLRHVLAVASGYSYSDIDTQAMMMTRLGLDESYCRAIEMTVDAMFIRSTAHIIQSKDGRVVIVAYRGTEPTNAISWLADAEVTPEFVEVPTQPGVEPPRQAVHAGFYRNMRSIRWQVVEALTRAHEGLSINGDRASARLEHPMERLYLTGHSLGGAMALLMGMALCANEVYRKAFWPSMAGIHTFGQPMVGTQNLVDAFSADMQKKVFRYVFGKDPVPHLPPTATGTLAHIGTEFHSVPGVGYVKEQGEQREVPTYTWEEGPTSTQDEGALGLITLPFGFITRKIPLLRCIPYEYAIDDHFPQYYVSTSTPPTFVNEFGDDPLVTPSR